MSNQPEELELDSILDALVFWLFIHFHKETIRD